MQSVHGRKFGIYIQTHATCMHAACCIVAHQSIASSANNCLHKSSIRLNVCVCVFECIPRTLAMIVLMVHDVDDEIPR